MQSTFNINTLRLAILCMIFVSLSLSQSCGGTVLAKSFITYANPSNQLKRDDNSTDVDPEESLDDLWDSLPFPGQKRQSGNVNAMMQMSLLMQSRVKESICMATSDPVLLPGRGYIIPNGVVNLTLTITNEYVHRGIQSVRNVASDISIKCDPICDCPGGANLVSSTSNRCGEKGYPDCVNVFKSSQPTEGCAFDTGDSETIAACYIDSYTNSTIFTVGPIVYRPVSINAVIKAPGNGDIVATLDADLMSTIPLQVGLGKLTITDVLEINPYNPGESFYMNSRNTYFNGNPQNQYNMNSPGWFQISGANKLYSKLNLAKSCDTTVVKCSSDSFEYTCSYDKSSTTAPDSLSARVGSTIRMQNLPIKYGDNRFTYTHIESPKITFSYMVNMTNVQFNYKIVGVSSFSCQAMVYASTGGTLDCWTTSAESDGVTRFILYNSNNTQLTTKDFAVAYKTNSTWSVTIGSYGKQVALKGCMFSITQGPLCIQIKYSEIQPIIIEPEWTYSVNGTGGGDNKGVNTDGITSGFNDFIDWFNSSLPWLIPVIVISVIIVILIAILIWKRKTIVSVYNKRKINYSKVEEVEMTTDSLIPQFRQMSLIPIASANQTQKDEYSDLIASSNHIITTTKDMEIFRRYQLNLITDVRSDSFLLLPEYERAPAMVYPRAINNAYDLACAWNSDRSFLIIVPYVV